MAAQLNRGFFFCFHTGATITVVILFDFSYLQALSSEDTKHLYDTSHISLQGYINGPSVYIVSILFQPLNH